MRNLSVIKGLYQGNGVTRRWAIPFEYNDTAQIFVTLTTYDEGDYTYRVLDSTEYTIDEDSVEIVYPKTVDDEPIPSTQYLTVWRDTDLLQLMDLTNQGAAWPDSIEASLDKLHQIVQELAEGLSRSLKVDIGDPQTPDEKLVAIQDYVLAAAESSRSASASAVSANQAAEAAATSEANAAESERLASGYADTATDAASRAEDSAISARAYNAPDYDNETTYQAGEVVTYTDGNSYRALQETTGNEPPNIIYWQKVTDYVGDDFFEVDEYGYIVPMDSPSHSRYWRVDQNSYIVPIEGGDGGYRPDTRQLSAEYLNVTNEGYIKHLRADDVNAQEVDADEVTAEVAAFNTFTANAVNAGTVTANSASVTEISAGTLTADDVIAKGPVVDVRAFGAKGDGVHDDTIAIQNAITANPGKKIIFPTSTYIISAPITTSATDSEKVVLDLCNSTIKAASNFSGSWMIDIGGTGTEETYFSTYRPTGIVNGVIDGNGVATGGVRSEKTSEAHFKNLFINNVLKYGMQIDRTIDGGWGSSDAILFNVNINRYGNAPDATSIGLIVNGYDNNIFTVRTDKFTTGIQINGGGNFLVDCHPMWHNDYPSSSDLADSIGFNIVGNDIFLQNCYSDMFATSIKITNSYRVSINNFFLTFDNAGTNVVHTVIKNVSETLNGLQVNGLTAVNMHNGETYIGYDGPTVYAQDSVVNATESYFKSINTDVKMFQNPLTDKLFNSVISQSDARKKLSDTNDNDDFNLIVAPGMYSVGGTFSKSTNHFPLDATYYGIMTVKSMPAIKNSTYYAVEQIISNSNDNEVYRRLYYAEADPLTDSTGWSAWKKMTLAALS